MSISASPTQYLPSLPRDWRRTAVQIAAGLAAVAREMSFVEHLEELRRRLICHAVAVEGPGHRQPERQGHAGGRALPFVAVRPDSGVALHRSRSLPA